MLGGETNEGGSDGLRVGLDHIAHLAIGDDFGKTTHAGHEHRLLEMIGNLRHATLSSRLVRLGNEVGSCEIVAHLVIGHKLCLPFNAVIDIQAPGQLDVFLAIAIELASHDKPHVGRTLLEERGKGFDEPIQSLIVADETKEEEVPTSGIESKISTALFTRNGLAEVIVERMGRKYTRLADIDLELVDIVEHTLRHGHITIDRTAEPPGERTIAGTRLVRNEVVKDTDDTGSTIATSQCGYRAKTRAHKRQPELDDQQVGRHTADPATHADPVERIARIHATCNPEIGRR